MFGFRFVKVQPTMFLLQYKNGTVVREGVGMSFIYYAPMSSLVAVPIASADVPFIFKEVTADFQEVTIQGQATYRITDPKKVSQLLNFTLDPSARNYVSDDPQKLPQRVINLVNVLTRAELQNLSLQDALKASDMLVQQVTAGLAASPEIATLGLQVMGLSILAIKPTPETARALEAEAREQLLRKADEAIYNRRNAAVEQERAIKENELNTEIAVENKKRQVREAQMQIEQAVQEKQHQMRQAEMLTKISLEEKNKQLVALSVENAKNEADARAYAISSIMRSLQGVDTKTLQVLASVGMKPEQMVALAFQGIADGAERIGQLNVSPDLLRELLSTTSDHHDGSGH